MLQATTPSFAPSRPPTMLETALLPQTITVQDTTAPEFTFVPADYTVECSDEMPLDDATASDNCGEVTIEVSSETTPATQRATTPSFARSLRRTMQATALLPRRPSRLRHRLLNSFVPADYTVECSDEMPMDDATASDNCGEVTIEVSSETMLATQRTTIVRTFLRRTTLATALLPQTITVQDTTAPEFTFVLQTTP